MFEFRPGDGGIGGKAVVASLPLARGTPDLLILRLPCEARDSQSSFRSLNLDVWQPGELHAAQSPLFYPDVGDELFASVGQGSVQVRLGGEEILSATVVHGPGCSVDVAFENGMWRLGTDDEELSVEAGAPVIGELSFQGPAASSSVSSVTVTTREFDTERSTLQLLLLLVALAGLTIVIRDVILHGDGRSSRWRGWFGRLIQSVTVVDLLVLAMLLIWAVLIPPRFDDGWVFQRVTAYDRYSGNANFLAQVDEVPLGYWVDWLQSHWFRLSTTPFLMRIPNVVLGVLAWGGIRNIAHRRDRSGSTSDLWVMSAVFVVGYGAWGMTFRAEPFLAVLVVASLWLGLRFASHPQAGTLLAWGLGAALAVTAHPVGVLVLAPVLRLWRPIVGWVRSSSQSAMLALTSVLTATAVALLLLLFDSDLTARLASIRGYRTFGSHGGFVFDELRRYELLGEAGFSSPLQRTFVVFLFMGVVGLFLRKRGRGSSGHLHRLVGWSLLISIALLTLTPSKWPWHFGALIGLVALAVPMVLVPTEGGDELDPRSRKFGDIRGAALVAMAGFGLAWAWSDIQPWATFDLRTQLWWPGAVNLSPFDLSSPATWLALGALVIVLGRVMRRRDRWVLPLNAPPAALVIVASAAVVFVTVSTFAIDAVRTDGWTFARQSVEGLFGANSCGLGDRITVPLGSSLIELEPVDIESPVGDISAVASGFDGIGDFESGAYPVFGVNGVSVIEGVDGVGSWVGSSAVPEAHLGSFRSVWYQLPTTIDSVTVMVMGGFTDPAGNAMAVQWGLRADSGIENLGVEQAEPIGRVTDWSMITFRRPDEATHVRLMLRDGSSMPGVDGWVAASPPLGMSTALLASVNSVDSIDILVSPPLALYMPCIRTPVGTNGLVGVPDIMVLRDSPLGQTFWPTGDLGSAFLGAAASDRYYRLEVGIEPFDTGDSVAVLVSQRYLTGASARSTGEVEQRG